MSAERPMRVDGRPTACSAVDRINIDLYHEAQERPVIYGPAGKLHELARHKPAVEHIEAWIAPEPDSEEAALVSMIMGLAVLADAWVTRHGKGLYEAKPRLDGQAPGNDWHGMVRSLQAYVQDEHVCVGRLCRARLIEMLEALLDNERRDPVKEEGS